MGCGGEKSYADDAGSVGDEAGGRVQAVAAAPPPVKEVVVGGRQSFIVTA